MGGRLPTLEDLRKLSREEWEGLCARICALLYQTDRVDDAHGRGNGMDAYRAIPNGIDGFQFRRLDDRFGNKQAGDVRENISLARERCAAEMGRPLVRYVLCLNLDLEPGHGGDEGEIRRFTRLQEWARADGVAVERRGLTWLHAQLCHYPRLKPELFEDLNGAVRGSEQRILERMDRLDRQLAAIADAAPDAGRVNQLAARLAQEARVHHERGNEEYSRERVALAIRSMEDALRLVDEESVDIVLRARILSLLCGLRVEAGRAAESVAIGERALRAAEETGDVELLRIARGNLGYALFMSGELARASVYFAEVLTQDELDGDAVEIVRTLTHILNIRLAQSDLEGAAAAASRLQTASGQLIETVGLPAMEVAMAGLGTVGNFHFTRAQEMDREEAVAGFAVASAIFRWLEETAAAVNATRLRYSAIAQQGACAWHTNDFVNAETLFARARDGLSAEWPGEAARIQFNLALLAREQGRSAVALDRMNDARRRFAELGDALNVVDCDARLRAWMAVAGPSG